MAPQTSSLTGCWVWRWTCWQVEGLWAHLGFPLLLSLALRPPCLYYYLKKSRYILENRRFSIMDFFLLLLLLSILPLTGLSLRASFCCQGVASYKALSNNTEHGGRVRLISLSTCSSLLYFFFFKEMVMNEKPHGFTISLLYQSFIHCNSKLEEFMNRWMRRCINISVGLDWTNMHFKTSLPLSQWNVLWNTKNWIRVR